MTKSILSIHRYAAILMVSGLSAGLFGAGCAAETEPVADEDLIATTEQVGSTEQAVVESVDPQCNVDANDPQERHNLLWPSHETGLCPEDPVFTEDDASAECGGGLLKYYGYYCQNHFYGGGTYHTWTSYFRCCQ